jgi:stage II sporulation protein M
MADTREPPLHIPRSASVRRFRSAVRRLYLYEWEMWRVHYRTYFKIAARLLGIGFVLGFAFFTIRPDQEQQALARVLKALKDIPLDASPPVLAATLFYHNARASFFAAAAGWIPVLCLPAFDPLLNGAVLGLVVSVARHLGMNVPLMILTDIVPHGIFELAAILYVTSVGIHVSVTLGKKIFGRRRPVDYFPPAEEGELGALSEAKTPACVSRALPSVGLLVARAARSFLLVVMPLLLVAAVIEAFLASPLG